jgi:hypothetical protein
MNLATEYSKLAWKSAQPSHDAWLWPEQEAALRCAGASVSRDSGDVDIAPLVWLPARLTGSEIARDVVAPHPGHFTLVFPVSFEEFVELPAAREVEEVLRERLGPVTLMPAVPEISGAVRLRRFSCDALLLLETAPARVPVIAVSERHDASLVVDFERQYSFFTSREPGDWSGTFLDDPDRARKWIASARRSADPLFESFVMQFVR